MILACVQSQVTFADVLDNLRRVKQWLASAAQQSAGAVIFPECMLTGYGFTSRDEAMTVQSGKNRSAMGRTDRLLPTISPALGLSVFLHRETCEPQTDEASYRLFNASALVGPDGIVAIYHKVICHISGSTDLSIAEAMDFKFIRLVCESGLRDLLRLFFS